MHSVWCVLNSSKPSRVSLPSGHLPLGRSCSAPCNATTQVHNTAVCNLTGPQLHCKFFPRKSCRHGLNQQNFTPAAAEHYSILPSETPSSPQSAAPPPPPPPPEQVLVTHWLPLKGTSLKIKECFYQTLVHVSRNQNKHLLKVKLTAVLDVAESCPTVRSLQSGLTGWSCDERWCLSEINQKLVHFVLAQ